VFLPVSLRLPLVAASLQTGSSAGTGAGVSSWSPGPSPSGSPHPAAPLLGGMRVRPPGGSCRACRGGRWRAAPAPPCQACQTAPPSPVSYYPSPLPPHQLHYFSSFLFGLGFLFYSGQIHGHLLLLPILYLLCNFCIQLSCLPQHLVSWLSHGFLFPLGKAYGS